MTDLSFRGTTLARPRAVSPVVALYTAMTATGAVGILLGQADAAGGGAFEPMLLLLLRFMAATKFAGVIGAALLVHWRLRRATPRRLAVGYVVAVAIMAVAPGLIWSLSHVGLAAALFHIGLLAFLLLAWKDQDVLPRRVVR